MKQDPKAQQQVTEQPKQLELPYVGSASIHVTVRRDNNDLKTEFEGGDMTIDEVIDVCNHLHSLLYSIKYKQEHPEK